MIRFKIIAVLCIISFNSLATIQDQIDSLPISGGKIELDCGTYLEDKIHLRDNITIIGSGACTIIPSINTYNSTSNRSYNIHIRDLIIDGSIDGAEYIGLDLRNSSAARIKNVNIRNVKVGVYLAIDSYYNIFQDVIISSKEYCYQFTGISNENTILGGKCSSSNPASLSNGVWLSNSNNVKIFGTSFEVLNDAIVLYNGAVGTSIYSIRAESVNCAIKFISGSSNTLIIGMYSSNVNYEICGYTPYIKIGF